MPVIAVDSLFSGWLFGQVAVCCSKCISI